MMHSPSLPVSTRASVAPGAKPQPWYPPLPPPSPLSLSAELFPSAPPAFMVRLVLGVRRFLQRLTNALTPAELVLFEMSTGAGITHSMGAIARLGIVDELAKAPASAEKLADTLGLNADALFRTLRALATQGLFVLHQDGKFENTRLGLALRQGQLTRGREWALYFSSGSNLAAWSDITETLRTGKSSFDRVHGMTVWDWFDAHPDEREMFAHVMMGLTVSDAPVVARLYPFAEIKTLCDVGGGRGTLLSEILLRHTHLEGILAEGEAVLASARELLAARGVADRVTLAPGSFFEAVPSGADAYLLKNILHDWDDETCRRILAVTRRAALAGSRVIICESLVERHSRDAIGCLADLQMMLACSDGRERGLDEMKQLLAASGFRYTRHFTYPTIAIVEGVAI